MGQAYREKRNVEICISPIVIGSALPVETATALMPSFVVYPPPANVLIVVIVLIMLKDTGVPLCMGVMRIFSHESQRIGQNACWKYVSQKCAAFSATWKNNSDLVGTFLRMRFNYLMRLHVYPYTPMHDYVNGYAHTRMTMHAHASTIYMHMHPHAQYKQQYKSSRV